MWWKQQLAQHVGLTGSENGFQNICCPLHDDTNPSAWINFEIDRFGCYAGCGNHSLRELYQEIFGEDGESETMAEDQTALLEAIRSSRNLLPPSSFYETAREYLKDFLQKRGIAESTYRAAGATPDLDPASKTFGYLVFPFDDGHYVARKFIAQMQGERYLNSAGDKVFYGLQQLDKRGDVIAVEGIYDYLALVEMGFRNVIATLSTNFKEQHAFPLRGRTVFILFDADYAGFKGTQKAVEHLAAVGSNPIALDLRQYSDEINDPHEAYLAAKGTVAFQDWVYKHTAQYDQSDNGYIEEVFLPNKESLKCYKTNLPSFDATLGGGLKEGLHVFGGEPGAGKSALSLFLTGNMAGAGARILYCTYEISKRQCWSRVASVHERKEWQGIEINPSTLSQSTRLVLREISKRMRIVAGWSINEIERAAKNYDVIVVDYIQRMPGRTTDVRTNVSENSQKLSNLARDEGKIIICVSSLSRLGYGDGADLSALKESGDIEYVAQSVTFIKKAGDGLGIMDTVKNTRGTLGKNWLDSNLATCTFRETDPIEAQSEREFNEQVNQ